MPNNSIQPNLSNGFNEEEKATIKTIPCCEFNSQALGRVYTACALLGAGRAEGQGEKKLRILRDFGGHWGIEIRSWWRQYRRWTPPCENRYGVKLRKCREFRHKPAEVRFNKLNQHKSLYKQ